MEARKEIVAGAEITHVIDETGVVIEAGAGSYKGRVVISVMPNEYRSRDRKRRSPSYRSMSRDREDSRDRRGRGRDRKETSRSRSRS